VPGMAFAPSRDFIYEVVTMKRKIVPYLLILPHALFFGTFVIFPIFKSFYMSLTEWGLFQGMIRYVGFENYQRLFDLSGFRAQYFWQAVWVTTKFVIVTVPALVILALLLALLLNAKSLKGKNFYLTTFFLPTSIAVTVTAVIWRWIFSYRTGLVNYTLQSLGLEIIPWLTSMPWAFVAIVVTTLWWTVGWSMIILLGGLKRIPDTLYDAARVDGAGVFQRFLNVTLPGLKNVMMFVCITQALASFGLFGQSQLMTAGGPGRETLPAMLYIYNEAFNVARPRMGFAAAMSVIFGAIVLSVTFFQFYLFTRERKEGMRRAAKPIT